MFWVVGFLTFAIVWLYRESKIAEPLRDRIEGKLAHVGWTGLNSTDFAELPGRKPKLARWLWSLLSCGFCCGTWVAFGATWYALEIHPWHRLFWLTFMAGCGVNYMLVTVYSKIS